MRRIRWCNLSNDQKIVQHPHRSELSLNGRFGPWKVLDPGSHMERSHGRKFQAMSGAPIKKLPASPRVSHPSIPVADRGGEEVNVGFGDFRAGRSNQLLEPGLGNKTARWVSVVMHNLPSSRFSTIDVRDPTGRRSPAVQQA